MFIVKCLFSITLVILFFLIMYFFFYKSKGIERIKALEKVKNNFSKKINQPKLVIVGGSDVLYSFQTREMARALNTPVVNLGTNVGMGMGYLLEYTKEHIRPGDTVVACLAYSLYSNPAYHIFSFEYYRMFSKRKLSVFDLKQLFIYFFGNLKLNIEYVQKTFYLDESGCYFGVEGSILPAEKNRPLSFPKALIQTEAIRQLEMFKEYCKDNELDLWITFPSTLNFEQYSQELYLKQLEEYLVGNYQVIGRPIDYYVELEEIYNSVYHVNDKGQKRRTKKTIQELNRILNGGL